MWKRYRMWFGQEYAVGPSGGEWIRPPVLFKTLKPTRRIFMARNKKEASEKVHKFMVTGEIRGKFGIEEI